MKQFIVNLLCLFAFFVFLQQPISAQTILTKDSLPSILYENELKVQLNKFGMSLFEYPKHAECATDQQQAPIVLTKTKDTLLAFEPKSDRGVNDIMYKTGTSDVNVYWIHGLNGTVESWRIAASVSKRGSMDGNFKPRKITSIIGSGYLGTPKQPAYTEDYGIVYAANDWNMIAKALPIGLNLPPHSDKDFIIAHSQGGIVAREWLRNIEEKPIDYDNLVHGLVTFGSPHGGAMILNNTRPELGNKAPAFFDEACRALGGAIVIPKIKQNFLTRLLISDNMARNIITKSCDAFSSGIIPVALDNYHKRTTQDYYVGSPFLDAPSFYHPNGGLSDYTLKVPVVQFYGVEESPIMWRFFSSTLSLETDALFNTQLEFGYDKDDLLQDKVSDMTNDFQASYDLASKNYNYWNNKKCWFYIYPFPLCWGCYAVCKYEAVSSANMNKDLMNAYAPAIKWLKEANDYYLTDLVGARTCNITKFCVYHYEGTCRDPKYNPIGSGVPAFPVSSTVSNLNTTNADCDMRSSSINFSSYPYCCCDGTKTYLGTAYKSECYYKPNDGVVLAESAAAPIKTTGEHHYAPLYKSNHDQMKNSEATRSALIALYRGDFGPLFKVGER